MLEPAVLDLYERIIGEADGLATERCVQMMSSKDYTADLKRLAGAEGGDTKVLILHGDSDKSAPYEASGKIVADILGSRADTKIYEKAAHGLYVTHQESVLKDVLDFVRMIQK